MNGSNGKSERRYIWRIYPTITICIVVALIISFALFFVEMLLAGIDGDQYFQSTIETKRTIRLKEHPPFFHFVFKPDERYLRMTDSLEFAEYPLTTDQNGFIEPSAIHDQPDYSFFFLGGSTTECMFVQETVRFPYLTGSLVEKATDKKINSYNSGVSGNHSLHSINLLINKILPLQPDIVFLMHNVNDLNILLYEGDYWNENPSRSMIETVRIFKGYQPISFTEASKSLVRSLIPHLYHRIFLFKNMIISNDQNPSNVQFDEFSRIRGKKLVYQFDKMKLLFSNNLRIFIHIVQESGAIPVLLTQANRLTEEPDPLVVDHLRNLIEMGIEYRQYKSMYDQFNECIRETGNRYQVLVIDLDRLVPKTSQFMYDTMHFNNEGSKFVSEVIANQVIPLLGNL